MESPKSVTNKRKTKQPVQLLDFVPGLESPKRKKRRTTKPREPKQPKPKKTKVKAKKVQKEAAPPDEGGDQLQDGHQQDGEEETNLSFDFREAEQAKEV